MTAKFTRTAAACLLTAVAATAAHGQTVILEKHTIRDAMAINQDAVTFLKPKGWKVEGRINWYVNLAHQACVEVKVSNPDGLEQLETLAHAHGCWFTNPIIPMTRGQNYLGSIVHEPIEEPEEFVKRIVLPYLRDRRGARVIGSKALPEVAKALSQANNGVQVRSAKVRVEYDLGGKAVEEDFYISLYVHVTDLGVNNCKSILWGPVWTPYALRAAKGELDAKTPMLLAMANSTQVNPRWFAEYKYVCDLFLKRMENGIRNAVELSNYIRRNNDEIVKMYSDAYWSRAASQDRIARQFSNYIRGVEQYSSPFEKYPVQLPSGYRYAWSSPSGSYILSNDANLNPNVGSTGDWRLMKTAE